MEEPKRDISAQLEEISNKIMPQYAKDIREVAKPYRVELYKGDSDCAEYLTADEAMEITSKHIKETRKETIQGLIDNLTQILNRFENADQQRRSS